MPSLKELLIQVLPGLLPNTATEAVNGIELFERLPQEIRDDYAESSIRQHFSVLSVDPTSPIAKVDQGQGYYLRPSFLNGTSNSGRLTNGSSEGVEPTSGGRAEQREEKFRAIFMRWAELTDQFPMLIEHTKGVKQSAGINKWKYPDVVLVKWEVGEVTDKGFRLAKDLLEVMRSLGEQPFRLTSVELKVELTASTLRESFFQCVSNSKWAHSAQLAVACNVSDELVAEELRRLGTSYDVSVVTFGLDPSQLESLPSAEKILAMPPNEFEARIPQLAPLRIVKAKERDNLDWEHIRDLKLQNPDIGTLFNWVGYCLEKKTAFSVKDFLKYS